MKLIRGVNPLLPNGKAPSRFFRNNIFWLTKLYSVFLGIPKQMENTVQILTGAEVNTEQNAQLSQIDRAAGCVIVFAKSRRLELGDNILRTL